jgi:tRNA-specific 2-thiouridylase
MAMTQETVVLAMSGGLDSSIAAVLLKEQGYCVVGITMRLFDDEHDGAEGAINAARRVCQTLGIVHNVVDFRDEFEALVIREFIEVYASGCTPNPCVLCNPRIKWRILLEQAQALDARTVATGHYARVRWDAWGNRFILLRGADPGKDQSYVLWQLDQDVLSRALLPIGSMRKTDVRDRARLLHLKGILRHESQEICFIPDDDYGRFLRDRMGDLFEKGPIKDQDGRTLGTHQGLAFYTIGQRKGLVAVGHPIYVTRIDPSTNTLWVGERDDVLSRELIAGQLNWIAVEQSEAPLRALAQIRSNHEAAPAAITPLDDGNVRVRFDVPQWAVTPGQSVVFYKGDGIVGGGIIEASDRDEAA